jgi:hypothetical protein
MARRMAPALVSKESPLASLPAALDRGQRGWLQGLRYAFEIADLAMRRLISALQALTPEDRANTMVSDDAYVTAITDAWGVIDGAWRLKRFLIDGRLPRPAGPAAPLPPSTPPVVTVTEFRASLAGVKTLRDGFQHIDNFAMRTAEESKPVWGFLNWVRFEPGFRSGKTCVLAPTGTGVPSMHYSLVNPLGRTAHSLIDHVTLNAFEKSVDLSELHRAIALAAQRFEEVLRPQFAGHPRELSALVAAFEFQTEEPPQAGPKPAV